MSVSDKVLELIKLEIENDPENRGYAGKTDAEIQELLNSSYEVTKQVVEVKTPRISNILVGIAGAPNILSDEKDIISAKAYTIK